MTLQLKKCNNPGKKNGGIIQNVRREMRLHSVYEKITSMFEI